MHAARSLAWHALAVLGLWAALLAPGAEHGTLAKVIVQPAPPEAPPPAPADEVSAKSYIVDSGRDELLEQLRAESKQAKGGEASLRLGLLYLHGLRVPQDARSAQALFERAVTQGERRAAAAVAWCLLEGCVRSPDVGGALTYIARNRGAMPARMDYLEWLALGRQLTSDSRDRQRAQLLDRAVRARDLHAQIEQGVQRFEEDRYADSAELFRLATQQGSQAASRNLELVRQRIAEQEASSALASAGTPAEAQRLFARAQAAHRGIARPINYAEALTLYRQAAARGSAPAGRMLNLIVSRLRPDGSVDPIWMQQLALVDIQRDMGGMVRSVVPGMLGREPSPLYDLLPAALRTLGVIR